MTSYAQPVNPRIEVLESRIAPATVVALDTSNNLFFFDSADPTNVGETVAVTGLQVGENILGIDYRPANITLYALSSQGRLYTIDTTSGAATLVSPLTADPTDATNPFTALSGTNFGVDFNPVPDRLRVTSDAEQNLRINPLTGQTITDGDLQYGIGDPGTAPDIVGSAYTNSVAGAATTTLYGIDANNNTLVIQTPPNNGTLVTVGPLNVDTTAQVGFDIQATVTGNQAFASLTPTGAPGSSFYTINLTTGAATVVGAIGDGTLAIRDIAVVPTTVVIANNGRSATFTDVDGDRVTITVSKGTLEAEDFTLIPTDDGTGAQLVSVNFQNDDGDNDTVGDFEGANLSIAAKRSLAGGDGFVNVGYINSTGFDLGKVVVDGDLGQIDAGDTASATRPDVASITAQSIGRFGISTQFGATVSLESTIFGKLGALTVKGDIVGAFINVVDAGAVGTTAALGKVTIGGNLQGLTTGNSGSIQVDGSIANVAIKGNLLGGSASYTGAIVALDNGNIGKVTIGRDLVGGSTEFSGIFSDGTLGLVTIGGDLRGGFLDVTAKISAAGIDDPDNNREALAIAGVNVKGNVVDAEILAGFDLIGAAVNADVQIGNITVGLDFVRSSISAGISRGNDGFFGTADTGEGIVAGGDAEILARIASVTIKGQAAGTLGAINNADGYGIVAQQIGKLSIGNTKIPLSTSSSPDNLLLGSTGDLRVREYA